MHCGSICRGIATCMFKTRAMHRALKTHGLTLFVIQLFGVDGTHLALGVPCLAMSWRYI